VSYYYRKQIARQHSCHINFWPGPGPGWPCIIFFSSILIIIRNSVALSHTVWAYVGGSKNSRVLGICQASLPTCVNHAEFGRSRSNRVGVGMAPKIWERWDPAPGIRGVSAPSPETRISYGFRGIRRFRSKIANFSTLVYLTPPFWNFVTQVMGSVKARMMPVAVGQRNFDDMCFRLE